MRDCKNCEYYKPDIIENRAQKAGQCRCNPPVLIVNSNSLNGHTTAFPRVLETCWCGAFGDKF